MDMNSVKSNGMKVVSVGVGYVIGNIISDMAFENVVKKAEGVDAGQYDAYLPEVITIGMGVGAMVYAKNDNLKLVGLGVAVSGLMSGFKVFTTTNEMGTNYVKYAVV